MPQHLAAQNKAFIYFIKLLKEEKKSVKTILFLTILFNIFLFMIPVAIQVIINQILIQVVQKPTVILFIIILGLIASVYTIKMMHLNLVEKLQRRVFLKAGDYYANFFSQWTSSDFEKVRPQSSLHHFFEVFSLQKTFVKSIVEGFQFILQTLMGLLIISLYHPVFLLYAALLSVSIYFAIKLYGKVTLNQGIKQSNAKYDTLSWMEQLNYNRDLFRNITGSRFGHQRLYQKLHLQMTQQETYFQTYLKQVQTLLIIQSIASIGLLGIGGYLVFKEQLGLGQLVAAEIIITSILIGFNKLPQILDYCYDAIISAKKLFDTHEKDLQVTEGTELLTTHALHHWNLSQVSFTKKNSSIPIFEKMSFIGHPGEVIALYGKEGKGKSLLVNIMMKYQEHSEGSVTINHLPIANYQNQTFYEQVHLIKSDPQFFIGSLYENISFEQSKPEDYHNQMFSLLDHLGLWSTVNQFPDQLNQTIQMTGSPFSETQAKLLSLVRALYQQPSTLIIDSLFDSLDGHSIKKSFELLLRYPKMTTFIATSSEEIAKQCTRIIYL